MVFAGRFMVLFLYIIVYSLLGYGSCLLSYFLFMLGSGYFLFMSVMASFFISSFTFGIIPAWSFMLRSVFIYFRCLFARLFQRVVCEFVSFVSMYMAEDISVLEEPFRHVCVESYICPSSLISCLGGIPSINLKDWYLF